MKIQLLNFSMAQLLNEMQKRKLLNCTIGQLLNEGKIQLLDVKKHLTVFRQDYEQ